MTPEDQWLKACGLIAIHMITNPPEYKKVWFVMTRKEYERHKWGGVMTIAEGPTKREAVTRAKEAIAARGRKTV